VMSTASNSSLKQSCSVSSY